MPEYYDDEGYADYTDEPYDVVPRPASRDYQYEDDAVWEEPAPAPRQQSRRPRTSQRQVTPQPQRAQRYEPAPLDTYDDEEFYNDDPYLSYEDERLDRRPPRTQRPRQQVKISKPNLPKVTIPKSVTDSPLLGDMPSLIMIGVSLLSLAIMAFLVSDRMSLLGQTIPTHVSASGDPENLKTRDAVWNIPLLAGMVMLMNIAASWFISRIDRFATRFLLAAGLLVHFIAWVALVKYLWE